MTVVQFPKRDVFSPGTTICHAEPASIIILPVVRIERNPDRPCDGLGDILVDDFARRTGRRRRRSGVDAKASPD